MPIFFQKKSKIWLCVVDFDHYVVIKIHNAVSWISAVEQSTGVKIHNETGSLWTSIIASGLKSAVAFFGTAPAVA